ncbi:MAG: CHASE2 domain-containing protein [Okeania sp. SIO3B5]|uniref:CHASE2 domain-containing protein n=1 Tax=Okeania sp. SIO3B5 TaxID=2607811 RepID=UPI0014004F94|nr:CHASE2 domain-containing protein [Okeania sp. SIO3B5]NEO55462.1 CHASE2 domain-containing protein [Okeania sp. SIO3B5]
MNYQSTGGSLSANNPTYVVRKQDGELSQKLQAGEYCYVFNARQMGKSSLRVRVMKELRSQGCQCIPIDMTILCDFSIEKQSWYEGFFREIFYRCELDNSINYQQWVISHQHLTNLQRFAQFIEEILFVNFPNPQKIYIFLDEIDVLVNCPFKNEILAFIRSCYNRRAEDKKSDYHRLIFCFFGVATPEDLIRDTKHTPFNIGHPIELTELTFADGKVLTQGLDGIVEEPEIVLQQVFDWSGGQPFLTQKLCQIIVDYADDSEPDVDKLVEEHILTYWEEKDNPTHLKYMHDYLVNHGQLAPQLLKLYKKILLQGEVKADDSRIQMALRLSGVVIKKQDKLVIFNKIYQTIFNLDWVSEKLAYLESNLELPQPKPKKLGMSVVFAGLVWVGVVSFRSLGWLQNLELNEYDRLMRWRNPELPDPNILIVEVTVKDINKYGIGSDLSDEILTEVIAKLEIHKPTIIGLDFWREKPLPSESGYKKLLKILSNNQKIVAVCSASEYHKNKPGTKPPQGVPEERLGFTDFVVDNGQIDVLRRHLMFMGKEEQDPCKTSYSLSARVAFNYLESQGIKLEFTSSGSIKVGDVVFQELVERQGIYQKFDDGGFQVLLNYRNAERVANYISISDLLSGEFDSFFVRDKIVLIGSTDPYANDKFYTPYSYVETISQKQMSGVVLHAHQVSQIIRAVLDRRPLITFWSWWLEWLWIFGWCGVGSAIGCYFRRVLLFVLLIGGNIIILYSVSLFFFTQGFVLPLVPSILALMISGVGVFFVSIQ